MENALHTHRRAEPYTPGRHLSCTSCNIWTGLWSNAKIPLHYKWGTLLVWGPHNPSWGTQMVYVNMHTSICFLSPSPISSNLVGTYTKLQRKKNATGKNVLFPAGNPTESVTLGKLVTLNPAKLIDAKKGRGLQRGRWNRKSWAMSEVLNSNLRQMLAGKAVS